MILYHGRFQPPHSGHIKMIVTALNEYPEQTMLVSMDSGNGDKNNPYSFHDRKMAMVGQLIGYSDRVLIKEHPTGKNAEECMHNIYNSVKGFDIQYVLLGPEPRDYVEDVWKSKYPIEVIQLTEERFFNVSATKLRKYAAKGKENCCKRQKPFTMR